MTHETLRGTEPIPQRPALPPARGRLRTRDPGQRRHRPGSLPRGRPRPHHTKSTGTLLCYFGCDHPDVDYLHRAEFEAAEAAGAVSMRPTFSCVPEDGARFVQDRIAKESEEVWAALEAGGRVYICGDGRRMAPAVREAFMAIYRTYTGAGDDEASAWLNALIESGTHVEDVWAG
jgi:cytochrome P450 / NADPH-cytochrome P450 reductase